MILAKAPTRVSKTDRMLEFGRGVVIPLSTISTMD